MSSALRHRPSHAPRRNARSGSLLVWLLAMIAVVAIGAGIALPTLAQLDDAAAESATQQQQRGLGDGVLEYFRDVRKLPSALAALERTDKSTGWSGPYLAVRGTHPLSGLSTNLVDGWGRAFVLKSVSTSVLRIRSTGPDAKSGNADDLVRDVDVSPIRYELTRTTLQTLNRSIAEYREAYPDPLDALPAAVGAALAKLVARGYQPSATAYKTDGWGDALVPRLGALGELVGVDSQHCAAEPLYF
jgi:type II secretory pathway pseudopilin PulG